MAWEAGRVSVEAKVTFCLRPPALRPLHTPPAARRPAGGGGDDGGGARKGDTARPRLHHPGCLCANAYGGAGTGVGERRSCGELASGGGVGEGRRLVASGCTFLFFLHL